MALERDSRLGKYNIRQRIGAGGMGDVYRARDEVLQRQVAIKTILADKASDREFLSRFRREAFAISRIDHPHIVKLLDFVEAQNGQPSFMVMEFLPGRDLGRVIKDGPLAISRAVDRILEVCAAVGECHRLGYVHRDLKPTNIFLAEYNQIETAKVLDFGAAKQEERREGDAEDTELTKNGTFLGTPYYMPPEQILGHPATARSDQYSLAVVLYTALAGQKPFEADKRKEFKDFELLQAIKQGDHVPLRARRGEVESGLADVVERAMNVDPAKRFVDLHAFGAELRNWASPQAKLTWEAHFTSSPPVRVDPQKSIAIVATADRAKANPLSTAAAPPVDPTMPPPELAPGTGPTVAGTPERQETLPLGTAELRVLSEELSLATTLRRPSDPPSESISIVFDESPQSVKREPSGAPPDTPPGPAGWRGLVHRPAILVGGASLVFAIALLAAVGLSHRKQSAQPPLRPPGDLFAQPAVHTPPPIAPSAAPPVSIPVPPAPEEQTEDEKPLRQARHHSHRTAKVILDPHGIPIPSD